MNKTFCHKSKLVIATDAYAPQINGVVRTLEKTVEILTDRGYSVDVICPDDFKSIGSNRVPGMRFAFPDRTIEGRLSGANAVHIATEGPIGFAVKRYCDRKKIRYTTALHTDYGKYMKANFYFPHCLTYSYLRWFHNHSEAVMVPSQSMIKELEALDFKNCVFWGRGVDKEIFNPDASNDYLNDLLLPIDLPRPHFLNVGRVSKEKNIESFLKLDLPGSKIVVGDGPDKDRLKKKYPDVSFVGSLRGHALAGAFRDADVFVFPSKFDTYGLVNIEAISCGTPVAAYPVTGPIDIVSNGITGFLNEDLETACLDALTLDKVQGDFDWNTATDTFIENLHFHCSFKEKGTQS